MKFLKWCELWTVSVCFHSWYKDCFFRNFFFWIFLTDAGGCTGQAEAAGNRLLLPVWKWISQFNQVHILIFLLFSQTNLLIGISDLSNVDGWPSFCFHTATLMGVLGGYWYWKVVLEFWFGHLKCHFRYPQNGCFCSDVEKITSPNQGHCVPFIHWAPTANTLPFSSRSRASLSPSSCWVLTAAF